MGAPPRPAGVRARKAGVQRRAELPAQGTGSRSSGARLPGCPLRGTRIATCNVFVGRSGETEAGEGLTEPEADPGLEMLRGGMPHHGQRPAPALPGARLLWPGPEDPEDGLRIAQGLAIHPEWAP